MKDFDAVNMFRVSATGSENGVVVGAFDDAGMTQAEAVNLACWLLVTSKVTQAELIHALSLIEDR